MDEKFQRIVSDLSYMRQADRSFHYAPIHFSMEYTRRAGRCSYDIHPYEAFTDFASRDFRKIFTRPEYVIQNLEHGNMPLRGAQPRFRPKIEIVHKDLNV